MRREKNNLQNGKQCKGAIKAQSNGNITTKKIFICIFQHLSRQFTPYIVCGMDFCFLFNSMIFFDPRNLFYEAKKTRKMDNYVYHSQILAIEMDLYGCSCKILLRRNRETEVNYYYANNKCWMCVCVCAMSVYK